MTTCTKINLKQILGKQTDKYLLSRGYEVGNILCSLWAFHGVYINSKNVTAQYNVMFKMWMVTIKRKQLFKEGHGSMEQQITRWQEYIETIKMLHSIDKDSWFDSFSWEDFDPEQHIAKAEDISCEHNNVCCPAVELRILT